MVSSTISGEVKIRAKKSIYNPEVGLEELQTPPGCGPNQAQQSSLCWGVLGGLASSLQPFLLHTLMSFRGSPL